MPQVRRVRRIIRKIDPWTVLKVSFALYTVMGLALVLGAIIFWSFVSAAGIPNFVENTLNDIGFRESTADPLVPDSEFMFKLVAFLGVAFTVMMTGITTLGAVMYNLISDVVGGLEVVVLEESFNAPVKAATPNRPVRQVASWKAPPPKTGENELPSETSVQEPASAGAEISDQAPAKAPASTSG